MKPTRNLEYVKEVASQKIQNLCFPGLVLLYVNSKFWCKKKSCLYESYQHIRFNAFTINISLFNMPPRGNIYGDYNWSFRFSLFMIVWSDKPLDQTIKWRPWSTWNKFKLTHSNELQSTKSCIDNKESPLNLMTIKWGQNSGKNQTMLAGIVMVNNNCRGSHALTTRPGLCWWLIQQFLFSW